MGDAGLLGLWHPDGLAGTTTVVDGVRDAVPAPGAMVVVSGDARSVRAEARTLRGVGATTSVVVGSPSGRGSKRAMVCDRTLRWTAPAVLGWDHRRSALVAGIAERTAVATSLVPGPVSVLALHDGRRFAEWLGPLGPIAAATRSPREDATTATLRCGPSRAGPDAVVQIGMDQAGEDRIRRAAAGLRDLAPTARDVGIRVPVEREGPAEALTTGVVPGGDLFRVLHRNPGALTKSAGLVVDLVSRWNEATTRSVDDSFRHGVVGPEIASDLATIRSVTDIGPWCDDLLERWSDDDLCPRVAVIAHRDLTSWNVLVDADGGVGIVDWESATADGLPLQDLWYLLADLLVTTGRSRTEAVLALRRGEAPLPAAMLAAVERLRTGLGIDDRQRGLLFDLTWVTHAANEIRRGSTGPFVAVVEALAQVTSVG